MQGIRALLATVVTLFALNVGAQPLPYGSPISVDDAKKAAGYFSNDTPPADST